MSDLYTELLVKKKKTPKDTAVKGGMIALTVLFVLAGLFVHPLLLVGAIGMGIADYFILPKTDLEYEYLFVNGDFDIDVIMSQQKRKKALSFSLSQMDLAAPVTSHRMDYYNGNMKMKTYDFSSGDPSHKRFAIIARVNNDTCRIILEPDEHLADQMKAYAPSKVYLD